MYGYAQIPQPHGVQSLNISYILALSRPLEVTQYLEKAT